MIATPEESAAGEAMHAVPWMALPDARPPWRVRLARIHVAARRVARGPGFDVMKPAEGEGRWALYFVFAPDGRAAAQHLFTLSALRSMGFRVLIVIATHAAIDPAFDAADGLIRKDAAGFDFSGYRIGLAHLAERFASVDVAVMNDSVFGPFADLQALFERTPWRMTGFTASYAIEPHIQSYAFLIKGFDRAYLGGLRGVLWPLLASSHHGGVAFLQESRLARVAARMGSVGSLWTPARREYDLTMAYPLALLDAGFPFLKRSVIGKFADAFDQDAMRSALRQRGHPTHP